MESVHFGVCTVSIVSNHETIMHLAGVFFFFFLFSYLMRLYKPKVPFYLLI